MFQQQYGGFSALLNKSATYEIVVEENSTSTEEEIDVNTLMDVGYVEDLLNGNKLYKNETAGLSFEFPGDWRVEVRKDELLDISIYSQDIESSEKLSAVISVYDNSFRSFEDWAIENLLVKYKHVFPGGDRENPYSYVILGDQNGPVLRYYNTSSSQTIVYRIFFQEDFNKISSSIKIDENKEDTNEIYDGWKIYRNNKAGFSFMVPEEWIISDKWTENRLPVDNYLYLFRPESWTAINNSSLETDNRFYVVGVSFQLRDSASLDSAIFKDIFEGQIGDGVTYIDNKNINGYPSRAFNVAGIGEGAFYRYFKNDNGYIISFNTRSRTYFEGEEFNKIINSLELF